MNASMDKHTGTVTRILRDYGFIAADDIPNQDVYFKPAWYRGAPPLQEHERVRFRVVAYGDNLQAADLSRESEQAPAPGQPTLLEWGYLGYLPNALAELRALALDERWEFKNSAAEAERTYPILQSYLTQTFARLSLEGKVSISANGEFAAFNTGLVDARYETIYAIFNKATSGRTPWQLSKFCISGEGLDGQNLVRYFNPLPAPAHYFDNPTDLVYDARQGSPELDWNHIVIDRIDRYPYEFVEDHCPPGFTLKDASQLRWEERRDYSEALGRAIQGDNKIYRRIMNRVRDAADLSIKRVSWNFKTAVPQYYPRVKRLQLLLPLCLVSDDAVDLALAVEKTPAGGYLGHTVLPLDWAYTNARLICRPDSDWLEPQEIELKQESNEEEEE